MKNGKRQYHAGKIKPLIQIIVGMIKKNPGIENNMDYLMASLYRTVPALENQKECANCGASMVEYIFEFDCLDAVLLLAMAKEVKKSLEKGIAFTTANQVRVQHLVGISYAMKSRTTQMAKLGLLAKYRNPLGKHIPGMWLITKRGWSAIRGEVVPRSVRVWRGSIEERTEETITLTEAFRVHSDKVQDAINKHKTPRSDYRAHFVDYEPSTWFKIGELHQGNLI